MNTTPPRTATFTAANGLAGEVRATKNGRVHIRVATDERYMATPNMRPNSASTLSLRPIGTEGLGSTLDMVTVTTPTGESVTVRTRANGLISVVAEGGWALSWSDSVRAEGEEPYWNSVLVRVA